jgi:hypothetical protein
MADITDLLAQLAALSDDEVRVVVAEATAGRPGLAALHAAATAPFVPGGPDVPGPVQMGTDSAQVAVPTPAAGWQAGIPQFSSQETGYTANGVPTFDSVREKVQGRAGRAMGAEELERDSAHGRTADEQFAARAKAGQERLAEIRKSLGLQDKQDKTGEEAE